MRISIETRGVRSASAFRLTPDEVETVGGAVRKRAEATGLSLGTGLVFLVNGRLAGWNTALEDGDVVEVKPAPSGG